MKTDRFFTTGSPLRGRAVPRDWRLLDPAGKRARLVALGWAGDLYEAGRVLAKHAAAASAAARAKQERATVANRRWED
jgi:hypothetical protein